MQHIQSMPSLDITEYYSSIDFSHWLKKIKYDAKRLHELKSDKARAGHLLELYSAYMQLTEILLINMKICTTRDKDFHKNLFISNNKLHDFITRAVQSSDFTDWFLSNYDFGIVEKNTINNYQQKYDEHKQVLTEVIEDYLKDFDFLNAYKHGYRVQGSTQNHTLSVGVGDGKTVPVANYDASLAYYSKSEDPSGEAKSLVFQNTISLKLHRVVVKAAFITGMLENIKSILAAQSKDGRNRPTKVMHFVITDKQAWNESFGAFRFHEVVARVPKP